MELRQMIYFKELSECLNLPAAARALYITPQALSKSMRVLAREFDTEIFYRDQGKLNAFAFDIGCIIFHDLLFKFNVQPTLITVEYDKNETRED